MTPTPAAIERPKNIDPPMWVAWNQAVASIRVRFFRQFVTTVGIALGIAFLSSMRVLGAAGNSERDATQTNWLIATSLLMCLVGITNSMLMSVAERYREIGTIKCLGASDGFIVRVFFLEAAIIGAAGSFLGAIIGAGLSALGASFSGSPVSGALVAMVILSSALIGIVMTILAAIAPAVQAARMPAAAALRVEV